MRRVPFARQKIDADFLERLAKKRELAAAASNEGRAERGLSVTTSHVHPREDPEDPAAKVRDVSQDQIMHCMH